MINKKILFDFSSGKQVVINGIILDYSEKLLKDIVINEDIYVITCPGSYTGIRKSISMVHAIKIYKPEINIYGINLLRDFATLFTDQDVFFEEKHITYYLNRKTNDIILLNVFNAKNIKDAIGNIENQNGKIIDFSTSNIFSNIDLIEKKPIKLEYYDKFA